MIQKEIKYLRENKKKKKEMEKELLMILIKEKYLKENI